jgi:hypothetical protein
VLRGIKENKEKEVTQAKMEHEDHLDHQAVEVISVMLGL